MEEMINRRLRKTDKARREKHKAECREQDM